MNEKRHVVAETQHSGKPIVYELLVAFRMVGEGRTQRTDFPFYWLQALEPVPVFKTDGRRPLRLMKRRFFDFQPATHIPYVKGVAEWPEMCLAGEGPLKEGEIVLCTLTPDKFNPKLPFLARGGRETSFDEAYKAMKVKKLYAEIPRALCYNGDNLDDIGWSELTDEERASGIAGLKAFVEDGKSGLCRPEIAVQAERWLKAIKDLGYMS